MPDVQKSQSVEVRLCYFPDALSMCYRRAANAQRAPHTRLGHATEAISHKIGKRMWRTLTCLTRAPKCVHSVFNAPVTRVELIRNVKDIRTRHARLLEKKNLRACLKWLNPNVPRARTDLWRRMSTYTQRTPNVHQKRTCSAFLTCLRRAHDVC